MWIIVSVYLLSFISAATEVTEEKLTLICNTVILCKQTGKYYWHHLSSSLGRGKHWAAVKTERRWRAEKLEVIYGDSLGTGQQAVWGLKGVWDWMRLFLPNQVSLYFCLISIQDFVRDTNNKSRIWAQSVFAIEPRFCFLAVLYLREAAGNVCKVTSLHNAKTQWATGTALMMGPQKRTEGQPRRAGWRGDRADSWQWQASFIRRSN